MDQDNNTDYAPIIELTADIVSSYVSNNNIDATDLSGLILKVHKALKETSDGPEESNEPASKPAVSPKKSITDDYLICLEDGKKFKSLKRHLQTHYNLTAEQYREKWNLSADYPMVAPNYAKERSRLAKKMGLGQQRKK